MVTTRRQVIDEVNSVSERPVSKSRIFMDEEVNSNDLYSGVSSVDVKTAPRSSEIFSYSTRTETVRRAKPSTASVETVKVRRNKEDFMPVISKKYDETAEVEQTVKEERVSASTRTKVILSIYLAIVVILAAVVIGTGIAVSNSAGTVSALESQVLAKNEAILAQQQNLNILSDETYITGRGVELNMGKIKNATTVSLTGGVGKKTYAARTNWFDGVCDWISGLFQ